MSVAVDWAGWPVVEIRADDGDQPAAVTEALTEAIARSDPFAAVVVMAAATPHQRGAGALERVRMVRRLRPGLAARCHGLAFVMPAATQRDRAKAIRSADRIWGCPTLTTDDVQLARAWARESLQGGS